jgi:predicted ATPase
MIDSHDPNSPFPRLDPDLLSTPFGIQTNWHVITGAPCSGKTTIIKLVAEKGFQVLPETGRMYVEGEIARGTTLDEIRANGVAFDYVIKDLQFENECGLDPEDVLFLDRGFPDSLAFFQMAGLDPNEILPECFQHRYASVFVLDRFPVQKDAARTEDDVTAEFLDQWIPHGYSALGYDIVRVPVLPPYERLAFILERLSKRSAIAK